MTSAPTRGRILFWVGALGLILFELANVWLIMPLG